MSRLLATLRLDLQLQIRNRFYVMSGLFVGILILFMTSFLSKPALAEGIPALFLVTIAGTTYLFVGGMILLEKGEGTLESLTVTPLRTHEYLFAKILTLSFLALWESLLIVGLSYGWGFNPLFLLSGILVMAVLYTLLGLIVVVRYQSVTDFILPSLIYNLILQLPFLSYFDIWDNPLLYLLPTQGPLVLMKAAFLPVEVNQISYGILLSGVSIGIAYVWSYRSFDRFIVRGKGRS